MCIRKSLLLLMISTCTCACFDCFASWFIIGLNSIQCVYTIVHLDTVFNAKNKIGIYLICYYIHNIYLSFLHLMLYGISFSFVLSSHIADIIWKILIIDVRKDTLRRAVSNQSAFSTLYTKASIQNESETSFYYASKHFQYQVFSCTGICILFVQ